MAKSRKRGGDKAHRKRIQNRNKIVNQQKTAMQKLFEESLRLQMEEIKKQKEAESGKTETSI